MSFKILKPVKEPTVRPLLARELPSLKIEHGFVVHDGFEKLAVEIGATFIARFPKSADSIPAMQKEEKVLSLLRGKTSFRTPEIFYVGREYFFDIYPLIPGVQFRPPFLDSLSDEAKEECAKSLGSFLAEIHRAAPIELARQAGIGSGQWPVEVVELRSKLAPISYDNEVKEFIDRALGRYERHISSPQNLRMLHNDFSVQNFAVDPKQRRIIGIFDFSDACIGDLHQDFQYLHSFGADFAETAIAEYQRVSGVSVSIDLVQLLHVVTLCSHVAFASDNPGPREFEWKKGLADRCREKVRAVLHIVENRENIVLHPFQLFTQQSHFE